MVTFLIIQNLNAFRDTKFYGIFSVVLGWKVLSYHELAFRRFSVVDKKNIPSLNDKKKILINLWFKLHIIQNLNTFRDTKFYGVFFPLRYTEKSNHELACRRSSDLIIIIKKNMPYMPWWLLEYAHFRKDWFKNGFD